MTARIVLSCDGTFHESNLRCRAAVPTTEHSFVAARYIAAVQRDWTHNDGRDFCPAHRDQATP